MVIVLIIFFVFCFAFTNAQYIYKNDEDVCSSEERNTVTISTLLTEVRKIQREVDQLRREDTEIRDLLKCAKPNTNCEDLYVSGERNSGVYRIRPFGNEIQVDVYCNMATEGGGWTAIQRRMSGSVGFNRTWAEYKNGFGNPHDSYWIGNDVMHHLTKGRNSSLYVSLTLKHGTTLYEVYHQFSISEEAEKYRLFLGGPANGTLGDMLLNTGDSSSVLSGMYFSTLDRDYDSSGVYNCAAYFGGGWWFNACHYACLNGPWNTSAWVNPWFPKVPSGIHVTETIMMIKPH